jgi:glycosyltransferase involved in cell wall biosynthesis
MSRLRHRLAVGARRHPTAGRVLIVVQNLPVPLDRRVWLEARALVDAGYGVSVICPSADGRSGSFELEGVRVHTYRPPAERESTLGFAYEFAYCWLRSAALAVRVLRHEGFDALQACNPPDTYFLLGALARATGRAFVFDHHDLSPELYESRFERPSPVLARALRLLERATFRTADHVIATNGSYRDIALGRGKRAPESVTVVRSGPDLDRLRRRRPDPGLKHGRPFLCAYLGVMGPQDGLDLLVAALDVIVNEMGRTDCHFALLGFGPALAWVQREVRSRGLEPWVTVTGRAGDETIERYLSTADVGLAPDPKNAFNDRCTMNKVVEYMAFGLPVVSFDLAESRVSAGPAADYVAGNDPVAFAKSVVALLDDPERRARMAEAGRRRVEESLCWPRQAPAYVAVYDKLLGRARRARR